MLRVVPHKSAAAARRYYTEGLRREDYYTKGQEVPGKWHGKAAAMLGLVGEVKPEAFTALVENRHPQTGERLTPRTKSDRLVGYDLTFNAPKSLSVLYALTGDEGLMAAFRESVIATMGEIEAHIETRVRRGGSAADRVTGNMAWAEFVHLTARPVGGIPDPHLHCHAFAVNVTWDSSEDRWKAAKFREIKKNARYSEAVFHSHLTKRLASQGYTIERSRKAWEIKGVPESVVDKFSRRTRQIESMAQANGITDAKLKDALGAASREGKRKELTWKELLAAWNARITDEEKDALSKVQASRGHSQGRRISVEEAVNYAVEKSFSRNSVVPANLLLEEAMRVGVGHLTPEGVRKEMLRRDLLVREVKEELLCTSLTVLAEEAELVARVRNGKGRAMSLAAPEAKISGKLSAQQQWAVRHVLQSHDRVVGIQGRAGVGKTTLMREVVRIIEDGPKRVFAFAPSAAASRETLREAGFTNAQTVAHLLENKELLAKTRGQVVLIDEAGLIGVRDLRRVIESLGEDTRIILCGDTRQHSPVPRGDAFRILQDYAGLAVAEVTQIRRQESELYRKAIEALSTGDIRTGFRRLEKLGAFLEIDDATDRYRQLAADYLTLLKEGHPPLVVSPTHAEGRAVTDAVRHAKREAGMLGKEREFLQLHNLQWEDADKRLPENYSRGLAVQFHQNAKDITKGAQFKVTDRESDGSIWMQGAQGAPRLLNLSEAAKFQVYEERQMELARGDLIRITRNGRTDDGRRISNGNVFTVAGFDRKGRIQLTTGGVLSADHGHLAYGYCSTSHAAQSKSVRDVLVAQSEDSFLAASAAQFYVSCSRGKQSIRIYTDSRAGLLEAVGSSASRMSALELAGLSRGEVDAMSEALGRDRWREALKTRRSESWRENVKSRTGPEGARGFVQNVLDERKGRSVKRGEVVSWRDYVETKRKMAGPDGKSRSKGHPSPPGKRGRVNGALPKRSELTTPTQKQMEAAHAAKQAGSESQKKEPARTEKPVLVTRLQRAARSSAEHFRSKIATKAGSDKKPEAVERRMKKISGAGPEKPVAKKPQIERAAEHRARQKRQESVQKPPTPVKNVTPTKRR